MAGGCAPGTVLAELSRLVGPAGASVGVEPDPVLRELALSRHAGVPLTILAGTADRLPVADDSVDVLYCERVLQHVPDVEAAVAEFCLLYTSDAADERSSVDLGGRRLIKKKKNDDSA